MVFSLLGHTRRVVVEVNYRRKTAVVEAAEPDPPETYSRYEACARHM